MHREAEKIDTAIIHAAKTALKKSASQWHMENWCPEIIEAGLALKFWRVMLSMLKTDMDHTQVLMKLCKRLPTLPNGPDQVTVCEAEVHLANARKHVKILKKNAVQARETFLEELATFRKGEGNREVAAIIEEIRRSEKRKKGYATLRRLLKPATTHQGSLSSIKVPTGDGGYTLITDATKIEEILIERNQLHYAQAQETPFGHQPLLSLLGEDGTNNVSQSILQSSFQYFPMLPNLTAKRFVEHLQCNAHIPIMASIYPFEAFKNGLKRWPEKTSTSPSGRDLSQYKSLLLEIPEDPSMGDKLLRIQHACQQVALERQVPFERWCQDLEVMLEKLPGNPLLHKLHIICLYEADWNLLIKYFWAHKLVAHCEQF